MNDDDNMTAIDAMNEHIDRMIKAVPKTVFGDLYRALLHSWQLTYLVGTPTGDLGCKSPFERAHDDFVAILKTANLGDLVEKLHDALAKHEPEPPPHTSALVRTLPRLVGEVEVLSHRSGSWHALTAAIPLSGPLEGHFEVKYGYLVSTLLAVDSVLVRPLRK